MNELCAAFKTTLPDDTVWDENDELVLPGGRAILISIKEYLESVDYEVTEPIQYSHYAWEMTAKRGPTKARLLISFIEPWLLFILGGGAIFSSKKKEASLKQIREDLQPWMESSNEFYETIFGDRADLIAAGIKMKEH